MSRENVELVRRLYDALNDAYRSGGEIDAGAVEEWWQPDCTIRPSGLFPESSEMHGHQGVLQFISAQMEAFERMWAKPEDFIDHGDRVVVPFRFGGKARVTGIDVDIPVVHVWTLRDGKAARLDIYPTIDQALEAVGLRE